MTPRDDTGSLTRNHAASHFLTPSLLCDLSARRKFILPRADEITGETMPSWASLLPRETIPWICVWCPQTQGQDTAQAKEGQGQGSPSQGTGSPSARLFKACSPGPGASASPGSWLDAGSGVHTTPAESDLLFHRICGPSLRGHRAEAAPAPRPGVSAWLRIC